MVTLREITKENYEECLHLNIAESQKRFVSSNVHSLAQAWIYYDTAYPFAVLLCLDIMRLRDIILYGSL